MARGAAHGGIDGHEVSTSPNTRLELIHAVTLRLERNYYGSELEEYLALASIVCADIEAKRSRGDDVAIKDHLPPKVSKLLAAHRV